MYQWTDCMLDICLIFLFKSTVLSKVAQFFNGREEGIRPPECSLGLLIFEIFSWFLTQHTRGFLVQRWPPISPRPSLHHIHHIWELTAAVPLNKVTLVKQSRSSLLTICYWSTMHSEIGFVQNGEKNSKTKSSTKLQLQKFGKYFEK